MQGERKGGKYEKKLGREEEKYERKNLGRKEGKNMREKIWGRRRENIRKNLQTTFFSLTEEGEGKDAESLSSEGLLK